MGTKDFALEMLGAAKAVLQDTALSKGDDEVNTVHWNNIGCAAQAMVESKVAENQVLQMLMKYWHLRLAKLRRFISLQKKPSFLLEPIKKDRRTWQDEEKFFTLECS